MVNSLYHLVNVTHSYSSGLALDGITVEITKGGCLGLVGCNGAGKSTLLYILGGLTSPQSGKVCWNDKELSPALLKHDRAFRKDFRRNVGIVFQDPDSQWLCDTVRDEVLYGPGQIWCFAEAERRALEALEVMGIAHLVQQAPYALSGGEKRRVALASIIAADPEVLLLDEPTASLDAATTDFLLDWLEEFIGRPGKTIIMATHDLALLRELADRCMVLTPCHRVAAYADTQSILGDTELLRQMNLIGRRSTQPKLL